MTVLDRLLAVQDCPRVHGSFHRERVRHCLWRGCPSRHRWVAADEVAALRAAGSAATPGARPTFFSLTHNGRDSGKKKIRGWDAMGSAPTFPKSQKRE